MLLQIARILPRIQTVSKPKTTNTFPKYIGRMTSIPNIQKAAVLHEVGSPQFIKYEDFPVPSISSTQVLVRNSYSGLNFIECYITRGNMDIPFPYVLGREAAGEVVAVGDAVTKFKLGEKVGYMFTAGTFAQYTAVEEDSKIIKLPKDISEKVWAAASVALITAQLLIFEAHPLKKGETALISAPVGSVGSYLVALAKDIGATVIGTTSSEEKVKLAKEQGADYAINYKTEDITERVKEITKGKGVNVSYDSAGASTFKSSIDSLAKLGTYVTYGASSGPVPPISVDLLNKAIRVTRPGILAFIGDAEGWEKYTNQFFEIIRSNKVKVNIYKEYPLSECAAAIEEVDSGKSVGKVILKL